MMEDKNNKKWSIHELKVNNFEDDIDVTNTGITFIRILILLLLIVAVSLQCKLIGYNYILIITPIMFLYLFYLLAHKSKNFILYNILYERVLNVKIITIDDYISPFTPTIEEIEKIILGINQNVNAPNSSDMNLKDSITFFWIRKNKDPSKIRELKYFIPYLGLILILYALKEKSLKLISTIGFYFTILGTLYVTFMLYLIDLMRVNFNLNPSTSVAIAIFSLTIWYLLTIYSALSIISIDGYVKTINKHVRKSLNNKYKELGVGYKQIINSFEQDSAVYIYDYQIDKYQLVDRKFLYYNLKNNEKIISKNAGAIITTVISIIFMLYVETTANVVTAPLDNNNTKICIQGWINE